MSRPKAYTQSQPETPHAATQHSSESRIVSVVLPYGGKGLLGLPATRSLGIVLFAHTGPGGPCTQYNCFVAKALQRAGIATLLVDLLAEDEASQPTDIWQDTNAGSVALLAQRLNAAADWAIERVKADHGSPDRGGQFMQPLGLFGAGIGAAATLAVAAQRHDVRAVIDGCGRVDLAGAALAHVAAATLFIVGDQDSKLLALNKAAYEQLQCPRRLEVVPTAAHVFDEPVFLDELVTLARTWFLRHMTFELPADLPADHGAMASCFAPVPTATHDYLAQ